MPPRNSLHKVRIAEQKCKQKSFPKLMCNSDSSHHDSLNTILLTSYKSNRAMRIISGASEFTREFFQIEEKDISLIGHVAILLPDLIK